MSSHDTICAVATAPGKGGVGIIRVSGKNVPEIAAKIINQLPPPRVATYAKFKDHEGKTLDVGLAFYFKAPNSFTGEDILELHGHGGPVVLDTILKTLHSYGARYARPGEFSERAFLNDKIDLAQAEAIADLIDSASEQAARCAIRSLQGDFSKKIQTLKEQLIQLRMYIEAAIDFPEEEIDFLSDDHIHTGVERLVNALQTIFNQAQLGSLLREGMTLVIAGRPNAGKSTLLNCLSGRASAIVTDIPGTTRDVMREHIQIDGLPLHIIDTAGLRETDDIVEREGVKRAWNEIENADRVLLLVDVAQKDQLPEIIKKFHEQCPTHVPLTLIINKIDLSTELPRQDQYQGIDIIYIAAKEETGLDILKQYLKKQVGYQQHAEGIYLARRRHLAAIEKAQHAVTEGKRQLEQYRAGELLAEELRVAQAALGEILGEYSSDDLLGEIFSNFCIGK